MSPNRRNGEKVDGGCRVPWAFGKASILPSGKAGQASILDTAQTPIPPLISSYYGE